MKKREPFRVLVAEDEAPAIKQIVRFINKRPELLLENIAEDGEEALKLLSAKSYDILFLDIDMPVISGLEVLEKLDRTPYVIFTTAYDKYAIKAFDIGAVDYLLKPYSQERFDKAVDKAISLIASSKGRSIKKGNIGLHFRENEKLYITAFIDILYLSSHAKHTVVHTVLRDFETPKLLKDFEKRLPKDFMRIHKEYIVNLEHIYKIQYYSGGQYMVFLRDEDNTTLPVGRKYINNLKSIFL